MTSCCNCKEMSTYWPPKLSNCIKKPFSFNSHPVRPIYTAVTNNMVLGHATRIASTRAQLFRAASTLAMSEIATVMLTLFSFGDRQKGASEWVKRFWVCLNTKLRANVEILMFHRSTLVFSQPSLIPNPERKLT